MKPKILHIIDTFTKGGAEVLLAGVIPNLPDYQHVILYLYPTRAPIIKDAPTDIEIYCLGFSGPVDSLKSIKRLSAYIESFSPNIIHTHLYFSSILIRFAHTKNTPVIQTYHNEYYRIKYPKFKARIVKKFMKYMDRFTMKKVYTILHVSKTQQAVNDFDIKIKSSGVMHNYIEDVFFKERRNQQEPFKGKLKVISVGNLKTEKNHILFLQALRLLKQVPIHVTICGQGNDERMLQEYINKYDLPVTLLGSRNNITELLEEHDLFVSCAIIEGFGISVAEAMASEIPMIISNIPTFKEVTNNKAVYFDARSAQDLASHIEAFYANPSILNKSIKDCKQIALGYKKNQYIDNLNSLYKKLLAK